MDIAPETALVRIKRILAELTSLPEAELNSDDVVQDILAADSLSLVEYRTALEMAFGVNLQDADAARMCTLASTAIYLSKLLSEYDASDR